MVGRAETDGGDEGNNIGYHMGGDDHFSHPDKGQWNHQIYHQRWGEVEAGDKCSSHPGWVGLEGLDHGWGNQGQGYSSPCHRPDPVSHCDTEVV